MSSKVDKFPFLHTVHPNTNVVVSRAFIDSIISEIPFNADVLLKRSGCREGDNSREDAWPLRRLCLVTVWWVSSQQLGHKPLWWDLSSEKQNKFCHELIIINRILIAHHIFKLATLLVFFCLEL